MDALFGFDVSNYPAYQGYARDAAHHILYTVVNSAGMNGFVHGVEFVKAFAYYKIILIVWDVLAVPALVWLGILLSKKIRVPYVEAGVAAAPAGENSPVAYAQKDEENSEAKSPKDENIPEAESVNDESISEE
jgi:hypothetical protein